MPRGRALCGKTFHGTPTAPRPSRPLQCPLLYPLLPKVKPTSEPTSLGSSAHETSQLCQRSCKVRPGGWLRAPPGRRQFVEMIPWDSVMVKAPRRSHCARVSEHQESKAPALQGRPRQRQQPRSLRTHTLGRKARRQPCRQRGDQVHETIHGKTRCSFCPKLYYSLELMVLATWDEQRFSRVFLEIQSESCPPRITWAAHLGGRFLDTTHNL